MLSSSASVTLRRAAPRGSLLGGGRNTTRPASTRNSTATAAPPWLRASTWPTLSKSAIALTSHQAWKRSRPARSSR